MQYQLSKSPFINVNINIVIIAYQYFLINALCTSAIQDMKDILVWHNPIRRQESRISTGNKNQKAAGKDFMQIWTNLCYRECCCNSLAASNPKDCNYNNSLAASNTKDCVFYSSLLRKIWWSPLKDLGSIIRDRQWGSQRCGRCHSTFFPLTSPFFWCIPLEFHNFDNTIMSFIFATSYLTA